MTPEQIEKASQLLKGLRDIVDAEDWIKKYNKDKVYPRLDFSFEKIGGNMWSHIRTGLKLNDDQIRQELTDKVLELLSNRRDTINGDLEKLGVDIKD